MKTVTVTVSGLTNSGKSTIAHEVAAALLARGFKVVLKDEPLYEGWHAQREARVQAIVPQVEVEVEVTTQSYRR